MPANFTVDRDGNTITITSRDDGQVMDTSYGDTANNVVDPDVTDGRGNIITWSSPVQDGTRGLTGARGPGTFNREIFLDQPVTQIRTAFVGADDITSIDIEPITFVTVTASGVQSGTVETVVVSGNVGALNAAGTVQFLNGRTFDYVSIQGTNTLTAAVGNPQDIGTVADASNVTQTALDLESIGSVRFNGTETLADGTTRLVSQIFNYDRIISGRTVLESDTGQELLSTVITTAVEGFQDAPSVNPDNVVGGIQTSIIGGIARSYNELALETICTDQTGELNAFSDSTGLLNNVTLGLFNGVTATSGGARGFNPTGTITLTDTSTTPNTVVTFKYETINGDTFENNTELQSLPDLQASTTTITQVQYSCSLASGSPIAGDVVVLTFRNANEPLGFTATRSSIHNGQTDLSADDWGTFELVIDGDLLVQGTIVAEALIIDGATLQAAPDGGGVLTVGQINTANINAGQITTGLLDAEAVTVDKINLNDQLTVNAAGAGAIAWGKSNGFDYNNTGLFLGNINTTNPVPRFIMGNVDSYIFFDGSELYIVGATNTLPNNETQLYSTAGTFTYPIAPTHTRLTLEMSGAGGGGGGSAGSAPTTGDGSGGDSSMTIMRRVRVNGEDTYVPRQAVLGGDGFDSDGLTVITTTGTPQQEIFVNTTEGFTSEGTVTLVTTASGGAILSTGTFNYTEKRDIPNNDTILRADILSAVNVRTVVVEDVTGFPTSGTIVFPDGDEFEYQEVNTTGGIGAHEFRNTTTEGVILTFHNGTNAAETVEDINRTLSFFSTISQDIGTHVLRTQVIPSSTILTGNVHTFSAAGGGAGASASVSSNDGTAGDNFSALEQVGTPGPDDFFRGDGGTAGIFGPASGGIGGLNQGVDIDGLTLDVSDGGGGGSASSSGANDAGAGGEDGTYLSAQGSGMAVGDGTYEIVSATDIITVVIGAGGAGTTGGTTSGGQGGDGAARIAGV